MLRIIICSSEDLTAELAGTFVGRAGVDRFKATTFGVVRTLSLPSGRSSSWWPGISQALSG